MPLTNKFGFIGGGNMAEALIRGLSPAVSPRQPSPSPNRWPSGLNSSGPATT